MSCGHRRRVSAAAALALPAVLSALALLGAPPAMAEPAARSPRIESCVAADAIVIGRDERNTLLDDADRAAVFESMLRRYPAFGRDGTEPSQILLWQRQGREWLFVTLQENPAQPGQACFTATFAAPVFGDLTPVLLKKYFSARGVTT